MILIGSVGNPRQPAHFKLAPSPLVCDSKLVIYANLGLSQITVCVRGRLTRRLVEVEEHRTRHQNGMSRN